MNNVSDVNNVSSVNSVNSVNSANSVNSVNSVNGWNIINSVNSGNSVNSENSVETVYFVLLPLSLMVFLTTQKCSNSTLQYFFTNGIIFQENSLDNIQGLRVPELKRISSWPA